MHGRVKVRTTAEQEKIKQAERQKKAAEFLKGVDIAFQKRKNHEWDDDLLSITGKLLTKHPDVYTLWNIRREIFVHNDWSDEERNLKLENELSITEASLRENPKSYYVWHQRTWIIEQMINPNWKRELDLCDKCLNFDERNFHCWDYRRFVINKANIPDEEELKFTTSKILNNFSNYSSWHYRSKILQKMYPSNVPDLPIASDKHNEELDLVMNATFTDPNDSSAWFYHTWLLDYWKTPCSLWQAVLTQSKITVSFHKEVPLNFELLLNDQKLNCDWKSTNGKKFCTVWFAIFEKQLIENYEVVCLKHNEDLYKLTFCNSSKEWIYRSEILSSNDNNPKLNEQLNNYQTLLEMEPLNKWAKLTSIFLMLNINPIDKNSRIIEEFDNLIKVDPLRTNCYRDMRSKFVLEYHLNLNRTDNNTNNVPCNIKLSSLQLTTLSSHGPYLAFYREINFSNNDLGNRLAQLFTLQECVKLNLTNNSITSLKEFPRLPNLRILLLSENQITNLEEICDLIKMHDLTQLDLKGNPIQNASSLIDTIKDISSVEVVI